MVQSTAAQLPTLQSGSRGPAVALLQRILVLYGHNPGAVDGQFGTKTKEAVLDFQRKQNVANKDGVVGSATWDKLTYPAGTTRP